MSYAVDPSFSVFHLVERVQGVSTLINHRRTMSLISYEIENAVLMDGARPRLFSSFQVMSKFMKQEARYRQIAEQAESVYVFGVPDVIPPAIPNIHYVYLSPKDQLAKEWFIVAHSEEYNSVLATEELTRLTDPDHQRQFKGIWTFNRNIAAILNDWLTSAVDAKPYIGQTATLQRQMELISSGLSRLTRRLEQPAVSQPVTPPADAETTSEVKTAVAVATDAAETA